MRDGAHGARAFKSLSALEGPNGVTLAGSAPLKGLYPWAAGIKSVPLPTATQLIGPEP